MRSVLDVVFILVQQTYRLAQCITAEGVTQLTCTHDLDHAGLALVHLHVDGTFECWAHLVDGSHHDGFGAHGNGHLSIGFALDVTCYEAAVVELNLVFLLGTPLAVMEHHCRPRDIVTYGRRSEERRVGRERRSGV